MSKLKDFYAIDRDTFCRVFYSIFPDFDMFSDSFIEGRKCLGYEGYKYKTWYDYDCETFYMLNKETFQIVSWYKNAHVGRALETSGIKSIYDLQKFLIDLLEDYNDR